METPLLQSTETDEIVLRLERYEDIFSSFDIRPYAKRSLSVDFLDELKRGASDKTDGEKIELVLLMPAKDTNEYHETVIKERLAEHFKKQYRLLLGKKGHTTRVGVGMVAAGIVCMAFATLIVSGDSARGFLLSFLLILLEPAAWFLLWEGMDQVIFAARSNASEVDFYRKMAGAHNKISFKAY